MFDIGVGEVVVIAVVGLLVFGPDRLPEMARQAASWMRDLRRMVASARREVSDSLGADERYLRDPKGSLTKDLLGEDAPSVPISKRGLAAGVAGSLGLSDVPTSKDAAAKALGLDDDASSQKAPPDAVSDATSDLPADIDPDVT